MDVLFAALALLSMLVVYTMVIWLAVVTGEPGQRHPDGPELGDAVREWGQAAAPLVVLVLGLTTVTFHLFLQRGPAVDDGERHWLTAARAMAGLAMPLAVALMMLRIYVLATAANRDMAMNMPYVVTGVLLLPAVIAYPVVLRGIPTERRFRVARLISGVGLCGLSLVFLVVSALPIPWPAV